MSTFCNDNDVRGDNIGLGFIDAKNGVNTSEIQDQIGLIDYHVLNKMGSSIPTIFARMFLFNSAYVDVVKDENKHKGEAHIGQKGSDGELHPSAYNYLISAHLDLLEFIFKYGKKLSFVKFDFKEINNLSQSNDEGLKKLADAINFAIQTTPSLNGMNDIHIIEYQGKIIGCTSPQTLVYTNPNWIEYVINAGGELTKSFDDKTPRALHERDLTFRKILYLQAKRGDFDSDNLTEFKNYIINSGDAYDPIVNDWWDKLTNKHKNDPILNWADKEIDALAVQLEDNNRNKVTVKTIGKGGFAIPLYGQAEKIEAFDSDYYIKPSSDEYKVEQVNGQKVALTKAPLVLPEEGIPGAKYYNDQVWDPRKHSIPSFSQIKDTPLSERILPGYGSKIPFLTIDDLLEPKIIEMAYTIDNDKFYTGTAEYMKYLLPIKKEFFRYFSLADLKTMLTIKHEEVDDDDEIIEVTLALPMAKIRQKVELKRIYSTKDGSIVDCHKASDAFNIGIFPFMKLNNPNLTGNNTKLNVYNIIVGQTSKDVECRFFQFGAICNPDNPDGLPKTDYDKRTNKGVKLKTKHISLSDTFDLIEVKVGDVTGIVLPKMPEIEIGVKKYIFAVDFGTSNTHIAWADSNNIDTTLQSLKIDAKDVQVVYLHDSSKSNTFTLFNQDAKREFMPKYIGTSEAYVKFPMRTAVYEYERIEDVDNPGLFGHINVGFFYGNELKKDFENNRYETDLKWNIENVTLSNNRIKNFCLQILWIIRNHAALNGGALDFKVILTYPQSMRKPLYNSFKKGWESAQKILGSPSKLIDKSNFKIESIAPYVKLLHQTVEGVRSGDVFVNIDIGGGSTDILYINPKSKKCLSYSVFFAANDIWGTGNSSTHKQSKDNGFIMAYENKANESEKNILKEFKNVASNASDVVAFLFAHPEKHFGDIVMASKVSNIVIVHFAAIIYYLGLILKNEELAVPKHISFTGMGSKYIELISDDNDAISNLINTILSCQGIKNCNVKVNRVDNPKEVTAEGAVYMSITDVEGYTPQARLVYGINDEDEETFQVSDVIHSDKIRERTIKQCENFIGLLKSREFSRAIQECGHEFSYSKLSENDLDSYDSLENSYENMRKSFKEDESDSDVVDALFFWPLKDTLYDVAIKLAQKKL